MKTGIFATAMSVAALLLAPQLSSADALTPQDYVEIEQLYAQYNLAIDTNDAEGWADTFVPDGVFMSFTGRDALIGFVRQWHEKMNGGQRRHWNSNLRITGDSANANGTVYLAMVDFVTKSIISTGMYKDTLVRTPQGWRFTKRSIVRDALPAAAASAK